MIAIENETLLPVPVPRVWDVLLAFDRYAEWYPFFRLRGQAVLGAEFDYIYTTWLARRTATALATIVELEPMRLFGVRIGIRRLFAITERFVLEEHGGGAKLRHGFEYRGLMARFVGRGMSRRAASMMLEVDEALRDYLRGQQAARTRTALGRSARRNGHSRSSPRGPHRK